VGDAVSPIWREFGLEVPPAAGLYSGTTLTICPPSLDPTAVALRGMQTLRPAPLPLAELPAMPVSLGNPDHPLVYLSLGTFSNNDLDLFRLVLTALENEPVNVLATIGRDNDPSALGPIPENARVEQYVPQADVLPYCAAVGHHAGAGTMFGVLAHGLPSVALPQSADNFINANLLHETPIDQHMPEPGAGLGTTEGTGCGSPPAVRNTRVVDHVAQYPFGDLVLNQGSDPYRGALRQVDPDRVAAAHGASFDNSQVHAGPARSSELARELVITHPYPELETRLAGLRDLQDGRSCVPPVSDVGVVQVNSYGGEVLSEGPGGQRASARFPPVVVLDGIGVHRLVGPAMDAAVGLVVAGEVHSFDADRAVHRFLPNGRGHRTVAPCDSSRAPDIH
jgi:hypothetical protein